MKTQPALIIFCKNPVAGKVKTRLAADIGAENALEVYQYLLNFTSRICSEVNLAKFAYYSEIPESPTCWPEEVAIRLQQGNDLGSRMKNAFAEVFREKYSPVVIIGTDCVNLSADLINKAFEHLSETDVVIGPASDGGYYLLGLKKPESALFEEINWSTPEVLTETINRCNSLKLNYKMLPCLHDIDEIKDLIHLKSIDAKIDFNRTG